MRELERAGDIPRGVNVRKFGREEFIGHHGLGRVDPDVLQSVAREARRTAHGDDQRIEGDLDFRATMLGDQLASLDPQRAVSGQHVHSRAFERRLRLERHVGVLAPENTIGHFDLRHLRTEPGKRLRQFAPDRPAAQHRDARRGTVHCRKRVPHRVAGQIAAGFQPRDRRDQRTGTRGDHDRARGQPLHAAILARDFDGPWIDHPAVAFDHIDTEPGVAFDAVMRLDCPDRAHHAFDRLAKRHFGFDRFQTISIGMAHLLGNLGALDQRLGRHAAGVEAIAPHLVRFDQRDLGLHRRRDQCGHQPGRSRPDHHQIAVEGFGPGEPGIDLAPLDPADDRLGDPRCDSEQCEGHQHGRRRDPRQAVDLRQLGARIHIDDRPH